MKQIRIILQNDSALPKLYEEGWNLITINDGKMYLDREVKKTRQQKKAEMTAQYLQFKEFYPKKSGITSQKVINKIDEIVNAGEFENLMEGVDKYSKKIFLEKVVMKFVLNPETYLNQRRWEDEFSIIENRISVSDQWVIPYLEVLTPEQGELVLRLKKEYESKYKKECTEGVLKNIINKRIYGIEY